MSSPRVSVLLPVRDGAAFLAEALASLKAQTFADFELIAVDDHSTDATASILSEAARRDPRIRVLASPGRGIVAALACGLDAARGELVARMDADDVALPQRLARQVAALDADASIMVLGAQAIRIDARGVAGGVIAVPTEPDAIRAALASTSPVLHPTVMMRAASIRALGGYRPCCAVAEDYDLWLRVAEVGDIRNLAEPLMQLRAHAGQSSRRQRLLQRGAAALARRLAESRAGGREHEAALAPDPASALALWLRDAPAPRGRAEARDLGVMIRALRQAAGGSGRAALAWRTLPRLGWSGAARTAPKLLLGV